MSKCASVEYNVTSFAIIKQSQSKYPISILIPHLFQNVGKPGGRWSWKEEERYHDEFEGDLGSQKQDSLSKDARWVKSE